MKRYFHSQSMQRASLCIYVTLRKNHINTYPVSNNHIYLSHDPCIYIQTQTKQIATQDLN